MHAASIINPPRSFQQESEGIITSWNPAQKGCSLYRAEALASHAMLIPHRAFERGARDPGSDCA